MLLAIQQVERFYSIWRPLLLFVNEHRNVIPRLRGGDWDFNLPITDIMKIRDLLWEDDTLLEAFIIQNPAGLNERELDLARSWKYRRHGDFFIFRYLKKYSILINEKRDPEVFAVKGLYSTFEEIVGPYLPILVTTVLLPFEGEIIIDSLLRPFLVSFGPGIRGELKWIYNDIRECGEIITDLLAVNQPLTREEQINKAEATNAKVLRAFQKYLFKSGLSPKIVERDVSSAAALYEEYLFHQQEVCSLREIKPKEVDACLANLQENKRRTTITGLKRFFKFLYKTGRMEWADEIADMLKSA
jgi:hypothetical protein